VRRSNSRLPVIRSGLPSTSRTASRSLVATVCSAAGFAGPGLFGACRLVSRANARGLERACRAARGEPVEPSESRYHGGLRRTASQRRRCMSITSRLQCTSITLWGAICRRPGHEMTYVGLDRFDDRADFVARVEWTLRSPSKRLWVGGVGRIGPSKCSGRRRSSPARLRACSARRGPKNSAPRAPVPK
jgi:hypothetical protein